LAQRSFVLAIDFLDGATDLKRRRRPVFLSIGATVSDFKGKNFDAVQITAAERHFGDER
jgi:hypothetical protein